VLPPTPTGPVPPFKRWIMVCGKNFCKCHNVPPSSTTIKKLTPKTIVAKKMQKKLCTSVHKS
jgi:hypothetical protein